MKTKTPLILNNTNMKVKNTGLFKPVFFKFCFSQNKSIIIIFSLLFFLCQIIIPVIAFLADKASDTDPHGPIVIYMVIEHTMFGMQSVMFIMLLSILYGKFITTMVNRGDLAYILCSRTSRKQIVFTFLMYFLIFITIDYIIVMIPALFLLGFKAVDITATTTQHILILQYFLIDLLQQFVVGICIVSICTLCTCIFNKTYKFFLVTGGVCIFFYLMNILQQFGAMNDSLK